MKRLLIPALGALGLGAVLLGFREAPPSSPPEPAAPVAALPLALPSGELQPAPSPGMDGFRSGSAAALPPGGPRKSNPAIGSEGYGPHIDRAAAGEDAAAAWDALHWLQQCDNLDIHRQSAEELRNQGVAPEFMTQRMSELASIERLCQTVTRAHSALRARLAEIAMRGPFPGAAAQFVEVAPVGQITAEQRQAAIDSMRRDAQAGHTRTLWAAALSSPAWGLSDEERLGYWFALAQQRGSKLDMKTATDYVELGQMNLRSRPNAGQMAAARQAGRELLEKAGQTAAP